MHYRHDSSEGFIAVGLRWAQALQVLSSKHHHMVVHVLICPCAGCCRGTVLDESKLHPTDTWNFTAGAMNKGGGLLLLLHHRLHYHICLIRPVQLEGGLCWY
jgi:hypothetical protein